MQRLRATRPNPSSPTLVPIWRALPLTRSIPASCISSIVVGIGSALAALCLMAAPLHATGGSGSEPATPESSTCVTVVEEQFGAYTVEKCIDVWAPGNPGNPSPVSGSFTYVYTLESDPDSFTNILEFDLETPPNASAVSGSGALPGSGGVEPDSVDTTTPGVAVFSFRNAGPAGGPCEGVLGICPGATSAPLIINSPYGPGTVEDNLVTLMDDLSISQTTSCVGPSTLPNPSPCSAFFWKLRTLYSFFVRHHFADSRFDQLTQFAADTSSVYASPSALLSGLFTGFWTTLTEAAERELSTLLLNIAAGELFPGNTKCRLFFDTPVDTDGDEVGDTTVGEILVTVESNLLSGDPALIGEARQLALKLNLGIGVLDTTIF